MAIHWGVDSATATTTMLPTDTLFDTIAQQAGKAPDFWGRYVGGLYALTTGEAQFLHNRECKILVIYNGATPTGVQGAYPQGVRDATTAITAAQSLSVPSGVWIYADIETSWSPTADWFRGWSDTMLTSVYGGAGGIYGNPHPVNAAHFNDPYCAAYASDPNMQGEGQRAAYVYSSEPEKADGCTAAPNAPAYAPLRPPCNSKVTVWQYAQGCFGGLVDEDLATEEGFAGMW